MENLCKHWSIILGWLTRNYGFSPKELARRNLNEIRAYFHAKAIPHPASSHFSHIRVLEPLSLLLALISILSHSGKRIVWE